MPNASQRVKALLSSRPPAVKIKLDLYRYRYCSVQYERRRRGAQLRFVATVPWKRQPFHVIIPRVHIHAQTKDDCAKKNMAAKKLDLEDAQYKAPYWNPPTLDPLNVWPHQWYPAVMNP